MITGIIVAAVVVGCVGIILGFFLGIAGEKFKVETDPREDAILEVLPGNNCGGCGYAGCSGLAAAIAKGEAPVNQCPVGGEPVAAKVGEIMGVSAGASVKKVAFVKCAGTCEKAKLSHKLFIRFPESSIPCFFLYISICKEGPGIYLNGLSSKTAG